MFFFLSLKIFGIILISGDNMLKKYLKENNLIIVPNNLRKKVIKEMNNYDLVNYKIMDMNEFLNKYFYSYNKSTIYYIMKEYDTTPEIALEYIKNLYYNENKNYNSFKLNNLVSLKEKLINNNLLEFNPIFKEYLKNTRIIIYNYYLDPFYLNIFSKYDYKQVEVSLNKKEYTVHKFNDINDEISYIISEIKKNIDNGTNINNIKIINSGSEYLLPLKRLFSLANIPINIEDKISLYDLEIGKKVLEYLKEDLTFEEIVDKLEESDEKNTIINIFNEYSIYEIEKDYLLELIKYDLKNTYTKNKKLNKAISLISLEEASSDDIVYLVGFNKENYPQINKDEDFLSDNMKKEVGLFTSNKLNENNRKRLINNLYQDINYIISYKLRDSFNSYKPSLIIEEENMIETTNNPIDYNFSNFFNKIQLAKELDNYRKYGIISDSLKELSITYPSLPYNTYSSKFDGLNNDYFIKSLDDLKLSYTKINDYYKCKFMYYLSYILKIEGNDSEKLNLYIGNIFHYVLSHYKDKNFDLEKLWNEEESKYELKPGEKVLINNLKEELIKDIETIKKQELYSELGEFEPEKEAKVKLNTPKLDNIIFSGKIDKIIYDYDNKGNPLVSVIDYKTGNLPKNFNNVNYGLDMQLPIYAYLIRKSDLLPNGINSIIVGFYLQKIINKIELNTDEEEIEAEKEKSLKLFGYSNSDENYISKFDNTYTKSEYIKGLAVKNDGGFYQNSRILNNDQIDKLIEFIDKKIYDAANNITEGDFEINPKRIKDDDLSCKNCPYKDICFRKETDYQELNKVKEFSFLGGEEDA